MEKRIANVMISAAGGTAGKGAKTSKIALPSSWVTAMGITKNDRQVELTFDGAVIIISRRLDVEEFSVLKRAAGHVLYRVCYYDGSVLCTVICADFSDHTLTAENHTTDPVKTAFGRNEVPVWEDFQVFIEERCIPRARAGLREYLETLGLVEYDPLAILQKTAGRMAEDNQWLELEVLQ